MLDVIIVGGGAAGFFAAINIAENNPDLKIAILERGKQVLGKVKVSGGGRCNVTHAEHDPKELVKYYPRGEKELLGPFNTFSVRDTVSFFRKRGIFLYSESDGRMFPESDSSQTIIDCFVNEVDRLGVRVLKNSNVIDISPIENNGGWNVLSVKKMYHARKVLIACGSSPKVWDLLENLEHTIIKPVPSLFTFKIKDERIKGLQGLTCLARVTVIPRSLTDSKVSIKLKSKKKKPPLLESEGPLLITHWGISGPAVLRLSAWGAKILNEYDYKFKVKINWVPEYYVGAIIPYLLEIKEVEPKKTVLRTKAIDEMPRRLWTRLVRSAGLTDTTKWADITKKQLEDLSHQLTSSEYVVDGKSAFKEEFVTAGGVDLREINFKTYESKIHPNLFFAGEVTNVDAITGGFNFQNAWTGAYIAAKAIAYD